MDSGRVKLSREIIRRQPCWADHEVHTLLAILDCAIRRYSASAAEAKSLFLRTGKSLLRKYSSIIMLWKC